MCGSRYREAYDAIVPPQELVEGMVAWAGKNDGRKKGIKNRFVQKAALAAAVAAVCLVTAVPVCAAHIPACYKIVEYLSPALADRLVPIEKSSTSQGITMQVEAIHLAGNEAEIIISMRDADGSTQDLVRGEMDLFDSYHLSDYASDSIVGGCHFLTYDAAEDKAYFQVNVQSDNAYQPDKLQFQVNAVLCDKSKDNRDVDLSGTVRSMGTKLEALSGSGGRVREEELPDALRCVSGTEADPRPSAYVLDGTKAADCAADDFTVTAIAYIDGVLRVQMCMGDNWESDRHVELFLRDADGNERYSDHSVGWHEDVGDTSYQFYEFWYIEEMDAISDYSMYGIFHNSGKLVKGDWKVTFRLE